MRLVILILISLIVNIEISTGQYFWTGRIYKDPVKIPALQPTQFKFNAVGFGDSMRIYNPSPDFVLVKSLSLKSMQVNRIDTIGLVKSNGFYDDYIPFRDRDVILSFKQIFVFDRNTANITPIKIDTTEFSSGIKLNDSLLLLHSIYRYHPGDAFPGAFLSVFNINSGKIQEMKTFRFPGISLSHVASKWAGANSRFIFIVTPLTGQLIRFNFNLQPIDTTLLPVKWSNVKSNTKFQDSTDEQTYREWDRIHNLYVLYGKDSIHKNREMIYDSVYSKDYIFAINNEIHHRLEYIESIIPFTDSVLIFTISHPSEKPYKYRDLLFYNVYTKKELRLIKNWRTGVKDSLERPEDFFTVDAINSTPSAPYFNKDKVYYGTFYNTSVFKSGNIDSVRKILFKDVKKNDYQWSLLEYSF